MASPAEFCTRCGTARPTAAAFCPSCGQAFAPVAEPPPQDAFSPSSDATKRSAPSRLGRTEVILIAATALVAVIGVLFALPRLSSQSQSTPSPYSAEPPSSTPAADMDTIICAVVADLNDAQNNHTSPLAQAMVNWAVSGSSGIPEAEVSAARAHLAAVFAVVRKHADAVDGLRSARYPDLIVEIKRAFVGYGQGTIALAPILDNPGQPGWEEESIVALATMRDGRTALVAANDAMERLDASGSLICPRRASATAMPAATAIPAATAAPTPTPARTEAVVYVVRAGDRMVSIADRYGVTVDAILGANKMKDPKMIRVGQKLVIPAAGQPTTAPSPTAPAVLGVQDLLVGDCIAVPTGTTASELRRLECTSPHSGEVFFVTQYPGTEFPVATGFGSYAEERCVPAFREYTGLSFKNQDYIEYGWMTPTVGAWYNGVRTVVCYVRPRGGGITSKSYRDTNP